MSKQPRVQQHLTSPAEATAAALNKSAVKSGEGKATSTRKEKGI